MKELAIIQARRKNANWDPVAAAVKPMKPAHEVLKRVLGIRFLEADVAEWVEDASERVPEGIASYLLRNSQDEMKHDAVMQHLADYYGYQDEAGAIVGEWRQDPSHPVVKACALEAGVFFSALPMLRTYGEGDIYADTVRQWILDDEQAHVATNRTIMKALGLKLNRPLVDLVKETIAYLLEPVPQDKDKWLKRSEQTLKSGKCDDFDQESVVSVVDPFTQRTRQSIVYLA